MFIAATGLVPIDTLQGSQSFIAASANILKNAVESGESGQFGFELFVLNL